MTALDRPTPHGSVVLVRFHRDYAPLMPENAIPGSGVGEPGQPVARHVRGVFALAEEDRKAIGLRVGGYPLEPDSITVMASRQDGTVQMLVGFSGDEGADPGLDGMVLVSLPDASLRSLFSHLLAAHLRVEAAKVAPHLSSDCPQVLSNLLSAALQDVNTFVQRAGGTFLRGLAELEAGITSPSSLAARHGLVPGMAAIPIRRAPAPTETPED